jgi:hypothetical protein
MRKKFFNRKLTATMVHDFIHDPILAAKIILGWDIPPHQQIRMMEMWTKSLTIDDSGFSTGKTATLAAIIALRSILFTERYSGIVSGTFRQSKIIFGYLDKWYSSSPIFRFCVKHHRGVPRLIHGGDGWEAYFTNGSIVRALPPGFTSDSTRLRSERWHDGYFDEWTTFDIPTLTKTLFGRVTALNRKPDHPIFQNHIHLSSTPGFTSHPSYEVVKNISDEIDKGKRNYCRFTCNWRHVPKNKKWKGFVDYGTIAIMQRTNPKGVVGCEIDGLWQRDSLSFYSANEVKEVRSDLCEVILSRKKDSDIYYGGFDSARGGTTKDSQQSGKGDDFGFSVFCLPTLSAKPRHVLTVRRNNVKSKQMASIVYRLDKLFEFKYITYDPAGGGAFVADDLKEPTLEIDGKLIEITPMVEVDDYMTPNARRILIPFKRTQRLIEDGFDLQSSRSDSVLINKMHEKFNALISSGSVFLAPEWDGWPILHGVAQANNMRKWLDINSSTLDKLSLARANADLAITQLISVDIDRDKNGIPRIDSHGMYKFTSRYKKDAAYSLLYAFVSYVVDSKELKRQRREKGTRIAFSIGNL